MSAILQRYYNRTFDDYTVMRCCVNTAKEHKRWKKSGLYGREDWQDKHRIYTIEPLGD